MSLNRETLFDDFENRRIKGGCFGHAEHVMVGWEMLQRHDFMTAVSRYSSGVQAMAAAAGAPEKFNATITIAFLSLIAERIHDDPTADLDAFIAGNPDLMTKDAVMQFYSTERLNSPAARLGFLLPDRPAA